MIAILEDERRNQSQSPQQLHGTPPQIQEWDMENDGEEEEEDDDYDEDEEEEIEAEEEEDDD